MPDDLIIIEEKKGGILRIPPQAVKKVAGPAEGKAGGKLKYTVTDYKYPKRLTPNMREEECVMWEIKSDGKQEKLPVKGGEVEIEIKNEWSGVEIIVMPYLVSPIEGVSVKTRCYILDHQILKDSAELNRVAGGAAAELSSDAVSRVYEAFDKFGISSEICEIKAVGRQVTAQDKTVIEGIKLFQKYYIKRRRKDCSGNLDKETILAMNEALKKEWRIPTVIGAITGYPETGNDVWRKDNDRIFINAVRLYNQKHNLCPGDDAYVTPKMLKAQAMVESGGHRTEFLRDPLQVNNFGDWAPEKTRIAGITQKQVMTPATSAAAALEWWRYKGYLHDGIGGEIWEGNRQAYRDYNGNTKEKYRRPDGRLHADYYADEVLSLYE